MVAFRGSPDASALGRASSDAVAQYRVLTGLLISTRHQLAFSRNDDPGRIVQLLQLALTVICREPQLGMNVSIFFPHRRRFLGRCGSKLSEPIQSYHQYSSFSHRWQNFL